MKSAFKKLCPGFIKILSSIPIIYEAHHSSKVKKKKLADSNRFNILSKIGSDNIYYVPKIMINTFHVLSHLPEKLWRLLQLTVYFTDEKTKAYKDRTANK